ncbi:hypothetical protein [Salarchaeum sp. JOR-1]|uniref:hypothetical protein n=1 Tax=Salarchaeum sp. JOR-1 TaxID=2599399 RepID=UPI0011988072|nr:hypothetical protein [Salarchaeum sp. JOR-1]QDX39448.1 hypothetical protein FQU85_00605 [Salarchaeum sp. JOR-1]
MTFSTSLAASTLFGGFLLLVSVVVLAASARYVWRASAVVRAPQMDTLAGAGANALVRLTGTVEHAADSLTAPFSDTDCVALRYQVEERRLSFLYVLPWYVTVHEATAAVPFDLTTSAATVSVDETTRTVIADTTTVATVRPDDTPPESIRSFARDHDGIPSSTWWQTPPALLRPVFRPLSIGTRRYTEQRIEPGDEVTVVGRATSDGASLTPLVVSDRSPRETVFRMARTSLGGLVIALVGFALGLFLVFV